MYVTANVALCLCCAIVALRIWPCDYGCVSGCANVALRMWLCVSDFGHVTVRMWQCKVALCMRYTNITVLTKYYHYEKNSSLNSHFVR